MSDLSFARYKLSIICVLVYLLIYRKYKLEEVTKHELLKCHRNCVKFVKAWEERLVPETCLWEFFCACMSAAIF